MARLTGWSSWLGALAPQAKLRSGSHIAVIGGGPAGSAFALFALHFARQANVDLAVTVFEARDFNSAGPMGCNMCAGLIPMRSLEILDEIGLVVPDRVIHHRIQHYVLYTCAGKIVVPQPERDAGVCSVYRGHGPRLATGLPSGISFDGFLLDAVEARGGRVIRQRVMSVGLRPCPTVTTAQGSFNADLVVLATGINQHPIAFSDLPYRPPVRQQMAQTEFCPGDGSVRADLGDGVHVFLPPDSTFTFATLVPKGPCINVSLMGPHMRPGILEHFLTQPSVVQLIPDVGARACGCRPHIAVGSGRPLYADGFVAIGDAGITRLYKNGIGTALRCARQAAFTAVFHGVSARSFGRHYGPLCRTIALDNAAGRLLFAFTHVFQGHRRLTQPHLRAIADDHSMPLGHRRHSRLLWGMFTGTHSYLYLLALACHPAVHVRLLRHFLAGLWDRPGARESATRKTV